MNTVECPTCRRVVVAAEVPELGELIMFQADEVPVVVFDFGQMKVVKGLVPHVCEAVITPKCHQPKPEKPQPWPNVECRGCKKMVDPRRASFTTETGWRCYDCLG